MVGVGDTKVGEMGMGTPGVGTEGPHPIIPPMPPPHPIIARRPIIPRRPVTPAVPAVPSVLNSSSQEEISLRDVRVLPNFNASYLPVMPDGSVLLVDDVW